MKYFCMLFLLLYSGKFLAQAPVSKVYGPGGTKQSEPYCIALAPDSGFFLAGTTGDPNSPGDALLIRTAANGDTMWTCGFGTSFGDVINDIAVYPGGKFLAQAPVSKVYGPGGTKQSEPYCIALAPDSGFFLAGTTGDPNSPGDALLIRTAANGDTMWTCGFGTSFGDVINDIAVYPDGSCAVTGTLNMPFIQQTNGKLFLARISAAGQLLWIKSYSPTGYFSYGNGIIVLPDQGYLLLGSALQQQQTGYDGYLVRVDSSGVLLWSNLYRMSSASDEDFDKGKLLSDGSFLVAGTFNSSIMLMKINSSGSINWAHYIHSPSTLLFLSGLAIKASEGCVVTGTAATGQSYETFAMSFNPSGDTIWTAHYGSAVNSEWGHAVCPIANGFLLTGTTESFSGSPDTWLTAIDTLGQIQWSRAYGDGNWQEGWITIPDPSGGYAVAAREQSAPGAYRFWLFKTDSAGVSGLCSEFPTAAIQGYQPATVTSPFVNVIPFGQEHTESLSLWRTVPVMNNCIITGISETIISSSLNLSPNPVKDQLLVQTEFSLSGSTILIYDPQGKKLKELNSTAENKLTISLENFAAGIYLVVVRNCNGQYYSEKFIVSE